MIHTVFKGLLLLGVTMSAWAQSPGRDEGLALMASRTAGNCVTCHDIPAWRDGADPANRLTLQGTFGPSLQGVGQRYSPAQLRQWVVDARVIRPDTLMPPYGTTHGLNAPARQQPVLTAAQIDAVVASLMRFTQAGGPTPTPAATTSVVASATRPTATPATTPITTSATTPANAATTVFSSVEQLRSAQDMNPVVLWVERGRQMWERDCVSCHAVGDVVKTVPQFPRLDAQLSLINLEDQVNRCRLRVPATGRAALSVEDADTLSLSAFLHASAGQLPVQVTAPRASAAAARWQQHLEAGERLYNTRMGHMNLSCRHCHDDKVGASLRAQRITPAHPVGFPAYRISWQGMGSMDRRIRACFSGVQAQVPAPHDERLRQLELYLKHRAQGQGLEGPSLKP